MYLSIHRGGELHLLDGDGLWEDYSVHVAARKIINADYFSQTPAYGFAVKDFTETLWRQ